MDPNEDDEERNTNVPNIGSSASLDEDTEDNKKQTCSERGMSCKISMKKCTKATSRSSIGNQITNRKDCAQSVFRSTNSMASFSSDSCTPVQKSSTCSSDQESRACCSKTITTKTSLPKVKSNFNLTDTSTEICRDDGTEWLSEVDCFKDKNIGMLSMKESSNYFKYENGSSGGPSTSQISSKAASSSTSNLQAFQPNDDHSDDADNESDDDGDVTEAPPHSKKRKTCNLNSLCLSDTENSTTPFTEEEELWLNKDIKPLPKGDWNVIKELRKRQLGQNSRVWTSKARASRAIVRRFRINWELKKHQGCVNALHFNQSGSLLASGSDDLKIMLWNWVDKTKEPLVTYDSGHRNNVFQAKFLPNCGDSTVISSARDGQVRLANISTDGACSGTKKIAQHHGSAHKIALQPFSSSVFLSCGEDGNVFLVDTRLERPSRKLVSVRINSGKIPLYSIQNHPEKDYQFAVSGRDPKAFIYDQRMIRCDENTFDTRSSPVKIYCPHHLQESKSNITCLVYNWNGSELLCSYNDDDIYLFNTEHSSEADYIRRYKGHRNRATVKGVNFYGPKSEYIISGSDCGNMFLWDKESSRILNFSEGDNGGVVNVLEPHPEYAAIATSGLDSEIKLWTPILDPNEKMCKSKLKNLMLSNKQERDDDLENMPDSFQNHLLWFLMQSLRNRTRREEEDEESSSDDSSYTSSDSTDSFGPEGPEYENMRCIQS